MPVLVTATKRILYLHVPKTGGTWVNELLRSYGSVTGASFGDPGAGLPCTPQHFHARLVHHLYATDPRTAAHDFDYVFMTVRDPLARLKSEFRYRVPVDRRLRLQGRWGLPVRFSPWALRVLRAYPRDPFLFDNHLRPQHEFRTFGAEVFRMEDGLDRVREALDRVTGLQGRASSEVRNPSERVKADLKVSARARAAITAMYREDFRSFGYASLAPEDA